MSQTLDKNTNLETLKERIGVGPNEELRNSHRRENFLRKFAALMSMDSSVKLTFNEKKAAVKLDGDSPHILIPTEEMEQPLTDFPRKVYDLLVQETLTLHEVGHILYSDWPSLERWKDELDEGWEPSFHIIWNAIEDGCIEAQLRREFNSEDELAILNANLCEKGNFGYKNMDSTAGDDTVYTMIQAIIVGLLNLGNYDSGHLDKILDGGWSGEHKLAVEQDQQLFEEFIPRIEEVVEDAHAEPNARRRNKIIYEFFLDAKEFLEKADVSGRKDQQARGDYAPMEGKPDDAQEGIGEARMDMGEMPGMGSSGDKNRELEPMQEPQSYTSVEETFEDEIMEEVKSLEGGEALLEEIENFLDMIKSAGPGEDNMELVVPDYKEPRPEIWERAKNMRRQIRTILRNRLNWHKDKREVRNRRRGKLDTSNMIRAARGDPRIFKQFKEGREKDYSCIIVQDRSGSMGGQDTDDAEIAVSAFSMALEDLGVDTMVLDFHGGYNRLAKPFGAKPRTAKGILSSGESGGGTPLTSAMRIARNRVEYGSGTHPFIIVVTDGIANDRSSYQDEINRCNFPVLGIYIRNDLSWSDGFDVRSVGKEVSMFHNYVISTSDSNLANDLYQLASQVMM